MSWLQNVGNFLEKLDGQAEQVATATRDDEDDYFLENDGNAWKDDEEDLEFTEVGDAPKDVMEIASPFLKEAEETTDGNNDDPQEGSSDARIVRPPTTSDTIPDGSDEKEDTESIIISERTQENQDTEEASATSMKTEATAITPQKESQAPNTPFHTPSQTAEASLSSDPVPKLAPRPQSEKEIKALRRKLAQTSKQLELAQQEIQAQTEELERAAERMEKDRLRYKQEKETEKTRHANELKAVQSQHEEVKKDMKQRAEQQMEQLRQQMKEIEMRRTQEGGDMNKELSEAILREQEVLQKCMNLEDEKATLLAQIQTLQGQQDALGSRIESLSQTADSAMEREREAETRLDELLSQHARQITQRQAREAELEQKVQDLSAALVEAKNQALWSADNHLPNAVDSGRELELEQEIENLQGQLSFERERIHTLKGEIDQLNRERSAETTDGHRRQLQHDREAAELKQTILKLQTENDRLVNGQNLGKPLGDDELSRIRELSEEVLKQRERLSHVQSENSTLKKRLQTAMDRASKAEATLESVTITTGGESTDIEVGEALMIGGPRRRRARGIDTDRFGSMRSALKVDTIQGGSSQAIGKALDSIDAFLSQSGKILRYNPFARLMFILYLIVLHVWTFLLIMIHAHGIETVHGDFGAGGNVPHGLHALMEPVVANAAADSSGSKELHG